MNLLIHESMIAAADRHGASIALQAENQSLLYRDLEQSSAALAAWLIDLDLKEGACVGLFMAKGIHAVISIYGILRAGYAYVPMDIQLPPPRLQHMLVECEISTLITTTDQINALADTLAGIDRIFTVIVVTEKTGLSVPAAPNVRLAPIAPLKDAHGMDALPGVKPITPDRLAAVLYTSGSTGRPKGVMLTHACVATFTQWAVTTFQLEPGDRCASHAPLHFDLSLFDIFATHRAGACAFLIPGAMAGNPKYLAHLIAARRLIVWQSVPSALVLLEKYGNLGEYDYASLRHVLFAGERMPVKSLQRLSHHFVNASFHNIYGATETNDTFMFSIAGQTNAYPDPLPIGLPLPYVDYKIVDEDLQTVPPGHEGELLVHAPTMMRGYFNGDDEAIVHLPVNENPTSTQRYYRTKDVARLLSDGNLHLLGRKDDIVKTNGYRINLLEIERVLQTHEQLSEIAVIAQPDEEIGNRIVAFVSAPSDNRVNALELKVFCAARLPKYAIPHRFMIYSTSLPKTSSGKIDKKRLLHPVLN